MLGLVGAEPFRGGLLALGLEAAKQVELQFRVLLCRGFASEVLFYRS